MSRRLVPALVGLLSVVAVWITAAPASAESAVFAPESARAVFADGGYKVGDLGVWSDGVWSFAVYDADPERATVRVLVFDNLAGAAAYRAANGPRLLSGFGGSAWHGNLALVQRTDDPAAFAAEPECDGDPIYTSLAPQPASVAPSTGVEERFLALLPALS